MDLTAIGLGTTLKLTPVTSTDTMVKGGVSTSVNTRHQVITAMKEYENKSIEELRMEDYTANRKGPSAGGLLSQGMTQVDNKSAGLFGQPTAFAGTAFAFGQNKSSFGTETESAFGGTSSGGLFGAQQTQQSGGLFGQKTGFGTTGTTAFGQTGSNTSAFGQTGTKSLFGQPASTQSMGLFGSTPASGTTGFGTGSTFGGTLGFGQTQSSSLFGKPLGFGTTTTSSGLTLGSGTSTGLFNQQSKTGLSLGTGGTSGFEKKQSGGLFGQKTGFGTTGTTAFGQTGSNTSAVGQTGTKELGMEEYGTDLLGQDMTQVDNKLAGLIVESGGGLLQEDDVLIKHLQYKKAKMERAIKSISLFAKSLGFETTTTSSGLTLGSGTSTGLFNQQSKTGLSLGTGGTTGFGSGFGTGTSQSSGLFGNKGTTTGFGGLGTGLGGGLGTGFGTGTTRSSLFGGATSKPSTLGGVGGFGTTSTALGISATQSTGLHGNISPFDQEVVAETSASLFGTKTPGSEGSETKEGATVTFRELSTEDYASCFKCPSGAGLLSQGMTQVDNKSAGLVVELGGPSSWEDDDLIKVLQYKKAKLERAIKKRQLQVEIQSLEAKLSEMKTTDPKPDKIDDASLEDTTPSTSQDTKTSKGTESASSSSSAFSASRTSAQQFTFVSSSNSNSGTTRRIQKAVRRTRKT